MPGDFIPLFPSARSSHAPSFSSVATAGPASSNTAFATKAASVATAGHVHRQVSIEIKRDGERISQVRIQCRCGELIELDCEY
jgi:hypothetical protein